MRRAIFVGLVSGILGTGAAFADTTMYSVFCADNKIEVDSRPLQQMQSARGRVCQFASFTSSGSARDMAKQNFGGIGARCTCGS